jgi:hypothetical protein
VCLKFLLQNTRQPAARRGSKGSSRVALSTCTNGDWRNTRQLEKTSAIDDPPELCETVFPFDATVLFGDLNYRLTIDRKRVSQLNFVARLCGDSFARVQVASLLGKSKAPSSISASMVSSTSVGTLMKYDQLDGLRKTKMFPPTSFEEGKITFPPTFKYDIGRDIFDSSKKRRCPAWTDRILFQQVPDTANLERIVDDPSNKNTVSPNKGEMLKLLKYDSIRNCRHSDHRPVVATFSVTPST